MKFTMFNRHPHMSEVMALRNADTKLHECDRKLTENSPLSQGLLNLLAIELCSTYCNLIDFIYIHKNTQAPIGENIQQILERLLEGEDDEYKADMLSCMPTVVRWKETKMPLMGLDTTEVEVKEVFEKLSVFYQWVDNHYLDHA